MTAENLETELETEVEGTPPPEVPSEEDAAIDAQARRMGWRPKEEYSGNPARWVDAKTFTERGFQELPVLRERYRKVDERLANTERALTESTSRIKEMSTVLTELTEMSRTAHDRGYKQAMVELKAREERAVQEANVDEYRRIQMEREQIEAGRPKVEAPKEPPRAEIPPPAANPVIQQWIGDNPWFNTDRVLNAFALDADTQVQAQYPTWSMEDKLEEVKKRTMDKFPEKFGMTRREPAARVATHSAPPPAKPKGRTVKDLPKEAREALERFKRQMPGYSDEDYLKVYDWDA